MMAASVILHAQSRPCLSLSTKPYSPLFSISNVCIGEGIQKIMHDMTI